MFCQEASLVKRDHPTVTVIPLRCKCWTCEECRPARKELLKAEARRGRPTLFITLTSRRRAGRCPHKAAQGLVKAWRTVRQEYMKRHGKRSLQFLAVFEATKQGWPHLHIVARGRWIDQRWLSKRMGALIGSPVVDVRRIKSLDEIAAYVSKYIGKNPHRFEGVKRYWRSLKYLTPTLEEPQDISVFDAVWKVEKRHWTWIVRDGIARGLSCEWKEGGAVLTARTREEEGAVQW